MREALARISVTLLPLRVDGTPRCPTIDELMERIILFFIVIFDLRLGCTLILHGLVRRLDSHLVARSSARTHLLRWLVDEWEKERRSGYVTWFSL